MESVVHIIHIYLKVINNLDGILIIICLIEGLMMICLVFILKIKVKKVKSIIQEMEGWIVLKHVEIIYININIILPLYINISLF